MTELRVREGLRAALLRDAARVRLADLQAQYRPFCLAGGIDGHSPMIVDGERLLKMYEMGDLPKFPGSEEKGGEWRGSPLPTYQEAFCVIALCQEIDLSILSQTPPAVSGAEIAKMDPQQRGEFLIQRYICPLNIALEEGVAEELLREAMTYHRSRFERGETEDLRRIDFVVKIGLVALAAVLLGDLRFLDALNSMYELLAAFRTLNPEHAALYAASLLLYGRGLALLSRGEVL